MQFSCETISVMAIQEPRLPLSLSLQVSSLLDDATLSNALLISLVITFTARAETLSDIAFFSQPPLFLSPPTFILLSPLHSIFLCFILKGYQPVCYSKAAAHGHQ